MNKVQLHITIALLSIGYTYGMEVVSPEYSVKDFLEEGNEVIVDDGSLLFSGNGLTSLEGLEILAQAHEITRLSFVNNPIKELPPGIFEAFEHLEELEIQMADFETIDPEAFEGLPNLKRLAIFATPIKSLTAGTFEPLEHLEELEIQMADFETIDPEAFRGLPNLKRLAIIATPIKSLTAGTFEPLEHLEELILSETQIESIDKEAFRGLRRLKRLELHHNHLAVLPAHVFNEQENLEALFLNSNQLERIEPGAFDGLPSLKVLYLSHNTLTKLPKHVFSPLRSLQTVYLGHNSLVELDPATFSSNHDLKKVFLENNPLPDLPESIIDQFKKNRTYTDHPAIQAHLKDYYYSVAQLLADLQMKGISIESLVYDYGEILLDLSERGLTSIDGISALSGLEFNVLNLSNNYLSELPKDGLRTFRDQISWLQLRANLLTSVPRLFGEQGAILRELSVVRNKLSELPDLSTYPELRIINVTHNNIQQLSPLAFLDLPNLEEVYLGENKLTKLPPHLFLQNPHLKIIHLDDNKIETFPPDSFIYLPELQELNLSNNMLGSEQQYNLPYLHQTDDWQGLIFEPQKGSPSLNILAQRALIKSLVGKNLPETIDMISNLPAEQRYDLLHSAPYLVRYHVEKANTLIDAAFAIMSTDDIQQLIAITTHLSSEDLKELRNLWPQPEVQQKLNNPVILAARQLNDAVDKEVVQQILQKLSPAQVKQLKENAPPALLEKITT